MYSQYASKLAGTWLMALRCCSVPQLQQVCHGHIPRTLFPPTRPRVSVPRPQVQRIPARPRAIARREDFSATRLLPSSGLSAGYTSATSQPGMILWPVRNMPNPPQRPRTGSGSRWTKDSPAEVWVTPSAHAFSSSSSFLYSFMPLPLALFLAAATPKPTATSPDGDANPPVADPQPRPLADEELWRLER